MTVDAITTDHPAWTDETPEEELLVHLGLSTQPIEALSFAERTDVLTRLRREVCQLALALDQFLRQAGELAREKGALEARHEAFRQQVRATAKEVAERQGWCRSGLNETLDELGLEEFHDRFQVHVTVQAVLEVDDSDGAESEDEAARRAKYAIDGLETSGADDVEVVTWSIERTWAEAVNHR